MTMKDVSPGQEPEEVLTRYTNILNAEGAESPKELAFLRQYTNDPEITKLLRGARAIKALFEAFGDFPDLGKGRNPKKKSRV